MASSFRIKKFISEVEGELNGNILPFWIDRTVDGVNGGFYGQISDNLVVDKEALKGAILNSRILWTFSKAYGNLKNNEYLKMADRAYDYMLKHFWDNEYSGLYLMVDHMGNVVNPRKQMYNIAFGIYGLSEYYKATGNTESLDRAVELFRVMEEKSYDHEYKGYFEAYSRDWRPIDDLRLSDKDMNEKKSMNTHLHILEAYTNLLRVWNSEDLRSKLKELLNVTIKCIIDSETLHFRLFFDEHWNTKTDTVSFGHDIEGSWLLYEAAQVLGDVELISRLGEISIGMAEKVHAEGIDRLYGGIINEAENGRLTDTDKPWWVQAEAMVGFINAYELTSNGYFFDAAYGVWDFIKKYLIDKKYGEWFWRVRRGGEVIPGLFKVEPWKCPYHSARACFEIIERLGRMQQ